jgi:hypothetical protein
MSNLQIPISKAAKLQKLLHKQLIATLENSLYGFFESLNPGNVTFRLELHIGDIVKVIRRHETILDNNGVVLAGADEINVELLRRLNHKLQLFGYDYGKFKIFIRDGAIKDVQPSPIIRLDNMKLSV